MIYLTERARRFEPVAAAVLAELDRLVKQRLGTGRVAVHKDALRELIDLDAPNFERFLNFLMHEGETGPRRSRSAS